MDRSASQTVGPYFHEALRWAAGAQVTGVEGERVTLVGRIVDGDGAPVADAMVETWQAPSPAAAASPDGKPHGMARVETAADGTFRISTCVPKGAAPCLEVMIFARGLLKALHTRAYLAGEAEVRADPALAAIAQSPRLASLVARPAGNGEWRWDVKLQGEGETVFFQLA